MPILNSVRLTDTILANTIIFLYKALGANIKIEVLF